MERTATAWLALEAGSGGLAIGAIFAARMLPSLMLGLVAGTVADRSDRPRQLLAVAAATVFLTAAFGWFAGAGQVQSWQVAAFSFVAGCLHVFDTPARQALVLDTVPRVTAARGLALNALAARIAAAIGALAAGFVIARLGVSNAYFVIAVVCAITGVLVATMQVAQHRTLVASRPPFKRALIEAARLIVDLRSVRTLFMVGIVCEVFAFSFNSALPLFSKDILAGGATGLGTLNAATSIGGAIAVITLSLIPNELPRRPLLGATFVLYGMAIVALAATRTLFLAATILLLIGFCAAAFDVLQQTLIQLSVPDEQRGRAVGVWILGLGSAPIGHLEMGAAIGAFGAPTALVINGGLTILSALVLLARVPAYGWRGQPDATRELHDESKP
jgi:predicted MFS family arabinose efflux permease